MGTVLLLDVDGVLQFPNAGFAEMVEGRYRWRHGYGSFLRDLFGDPGYLRTLVGEGDFLDAVGPVLRRHVHGLEPEEFLELWLRHGSVTNRPLLARLSEVRASRVVLASNQESRRGRHIEDRYGGQGWLVGACLSHRLGARKPDPLYFQRLLRSIGVSAADCLFVDDNPECTASAADQGIDSITFTTNLALTDELTRRGLLRPTDDG